MPLSCPAQQKPYQPLKQKALKINFKAFEYGCPLFRIRVAVLYKYF